MPPKYETLKGIQEEKKIIQEQFANHMENGRVKRE